MVDVPIGLAPLSLDLPLNRTHLLEASKGWVQKVAVYRKTTTEDPLHTLFDLVPVTLVRYSTSRRKNGGSTKVQIYVDRRD